MTPQPRKVAIDDPNLASKVPPTVLARCGKKILATRSQFPNSAWMEKVTDIDGQQWSITCEVDGDSLLITNAKRTKRKG